jgi:hypothetical protein
MAAFSFVESALYDPLTGQASLPSVFIAGATTQQYDITLCPQGNGFSICGLDQKAVTMSEINKLGNTLFDPATGIAEIPVIRIQGATDNGTGINSNAYSVKLQLVGDVLQVLELTPIW